ncbi:hypothetical protein E8E12_003394 [Didymella heteroderae]|uniref:Uncharacterized protein n=1 Tax=Didymella heteroderae TaxID=1769908 RepID=A0A9P5C1B6_9PLEO|nr:hypothetical protein E8E12_003394 [Didymella heteroderae]
MQPNRLFALAGFAASAAARALPTNASTSGGLVPTAGFYDPSNLASDGLWDKYQKKGDHYQCLFTADDEGAGRLVEDTRTPPSARSTWKGSMSAERKLWNWHENYFDEDNCNFEELHLKDAFDALKVNTMCIDDGGYNEGWALGHYDENRRDPASTNPFEFFLEPIKQTYEVQSKTYKSTGGYYTFVVNQLDGVIVALDISSLRNAVKTHWKSIGGTASPEDLPKLQYASDLMWGKWVDNNPNVKNLHYYVVHNILNDETSAIVPRAMRHKLASKLSIWPGTVFDKDKDKVEFQALIGSPIGGTIAIMLVQHKAELGNKEIYQVSVITDEWSQKLGRTVEMHMFFHIRDSPSEKPKGDDTRAVHGAE